MAVLGRAFARFRYLSALGALVATSEQYDRSVAVSDEVDPIAWAAIDPKFRDSFADRSCIAGIAK